MKLFGKAEIFVGGDKIETFPEATLEIGGDERTAVALNNSVGHTVKHEPSTLQISVAHNAEFDLNFWRGLEDIECQFKTDTGQTYLLRNAFQTGKINVAAGGDGKVEITLASGSVETV
jgi:hypothetical protein